MKYFSFLLIAIGLLVSLFWVPLFYFADEPTRVNLVGMFFPYTLLIPLGLLLLFIRTKKATR